MSASIFLLASHRTTSVIEIWVQNMRTKPMSALNNPIKLLYMQPFFDVFGCALSFGSFDFLSPVLADVQALNQQDTDSPKHYGRTNWHFLSDWKEALWYSECGICSAWQCTFVKSLKCSLLCAEQMPLSDKKPCSHENMSLLSSEPYVCLNRRASFDWMERKNGFLHLSAHISLKYSIIH